MVSKTPGRSLAISFAALAVAMLLLGASVGHVHLHGHKTECTLCQAAPRPELLDVVSLLETPRAAAREASPDLPDVDLTLVEVDSSISFRGPPA